MLSSNDIHIVPAETLVVDISTKEIYTEPKTEQPPS